MSKSPVDEELDGVPEAPFYVYSVLLFRSDGEEYVYVGSVTNGIDGLRKRILDHMRENGECSLPVNLNGREVLLPKRTFITKEEYDFMGVEEVVPVFSKNERHLREVEREHSFRCALEYETTNILGGK